MDTNITSPAHARLRAITFTTMGEIQKPPEPRTPPMGASLPGGSLGQPPGQRNPVQSQLRVHISNLGFLEPISIREGASGSPCSQSLLTFKSLRSYETVPRRRLWLCVDVLMEVCLCWAGDERLPGLCWGVWMRAVSWHHLWPLDGLTLDPWMDLGSPQQKKERLQVLWENPISFIPE